MMNIDDIKIDKRYELDDGRVVLIVGEPDASNDQDRRVEYDVVGGTGRPGTYQMSLNEFASKAIREI